MKQTFILLTICFLAVKSFSQSDTKQEKGYFNLTELSVFTGNNTFEFQTGPNSYKETHDGAHSFSIRNINGYFITNKIAIGVGLGFENYTHSTDSYNYNNLFLLFLDARYYFSNKANSFFLYSDIGGAAKIADNFDKGQMFNLGVGYKFKVGKKITLTSGVGYVDQSIKHSEETVLKDRYHGFGLRAGILF